MVGVRALDTIDKPPQGFALLQSCAKGEISLEDPKLRRGIFSHYVVEGLAGKAADEEGHVTLLGLAKYVNNETRDRAFDLKKVRQRPYIKGELTDFVLANISVKNSSPEMVSFSVPVPIAVVAQTKIDRLRDCSMKVVIILPLGGIVMVV